MATPAAHVASLATEAARRFAEDLRSRYGDAVLDVRLFGSFARGEAHEDSDVDVAVVLERVDWATQRDVIDLATDIGLARALRLSPTLFDRATYERWRRQERPLVMDIERDGIAL
jgi:predicted nucleotidyltransferase